MSWTHNRPFKGGIDARQIGIISGGGEIKGNSSSSCARLCLRWQHHSALPRTISHHIALRRRELNEGIELKLKDKIGAKNVLSFCVRSPLYSTTKAKCSGSEQEIECWLWSYNKRYRVRERTPLEGQAVHHLAGLGLVHESLELGPFGTASCYAAGLLTARRGNLCVVRRHYSAEYKYETNKCLI